jgi:hypothetical protein
MRPAMGPYSTPDTLNNACDRAHDACDRDHDAYDRDHDACDRDHDACDHVLVKSPAPTPQEPLS